MRGLKARLLLAASGALAGLLLHAPAALAAGGAPPAPLAFLGLPSLHEIVDALAGGFFKALANVLVPGWLRHGSIATIQHLVALPDPSEWGHVGALQADMVFLGAMLLPVTLAVGTLRYWLVGLTGAAHPATALARCGWVTFVLVAYRFITGQAVAATNTLTHGILGLPVVAEGLARIISVLFGGALITGTGGVFGAFLVIVGVIFAAGLFAAQVLLTVVLALLIVCGPPLIALSAIPELSHLARTWAHALMGACLVPLGWTVLFATAGALCVDATSFTGGAAGLPGHVAAAFAGLITFVIAVKLPLTLLSELRHLFGGGAGGGGAHSQAALPGSERIAAAHARLRAATFEGVPSLGRSAGRAAGALGAPTGGPAGAARRGFQAAARRSGLRAGGVAGAGAGVAAGAAGSRATKRRRGVRERLRDAGAVLAAAPSEARATMSGAQGNRARPPRPEGSATPGAPARTPGRATRQGKPRGSVGAGARGERPSGAPRPAARAPRPGGRGPARQSAAAQRVATQGAAAKTRPAPRVRAGAAETTAPGAGASPQAHPGRRVAEGARREQQRAGGGGSAQAKPKAARAARPETREQRPARAGGRPGQARPAPPRRPRGRGRP